MKKMKSKVVRKTLDTLRKAKIGLEKIDSKIKLQQHNIAKYQQHLNIDFSRGPFRVCTARNAEDLEACLRLRFEVFHREFLNKKRTDGVDVESLDLLSDHLMIMDQRSEKLVGTYRLNCSKYTDRFYSTDEFKIERFLLEQGTKLEMGRACIHKDYRKGTTMALLWRGIADYIQKSESAYLFGCASVKTEDPKEAAQIYHWFQLHGALLLEYDIQPTSRYQMPHFDEALYEISKTYDAQYAESLIPPLIQLYLKTGAKICGAPAYDRDFQCIDFLTLLKVKELEESFSKKYNV